MRLAANILDIFRRSEQDRGYGPGFIPVYVDTNVMARPPPVRRMQNGALPPVWSIYLANEANGFVPGHYPPKKVDFNLSFVILITPPERTVNSRVSLERMG